MNENLFFIINWFKLYFYTDSPALEIPTFVPADQKLFHPVIVEKRRACRERIAHRCLYYEVVDFRTVQVIFGRFRAC